MHKGVNIYGAPPSVTELEQVRKRNDWALFGYLLLLTGGLAVLAMLFFEPRLFERTPSGLTKLFPILFIGTAFYALARLIVLSRRIIQIGETGPETLEAILCSEVSTVTAYCQAVKRQGRMLTMQEAEALMRLCMHPEVFKKIVASYERHDEAHPFSGFSC